MKIKEVQLQNIISNNTNFLALLIYGPNDGLIRETIFNTKTLLLDKEAYEEINIDGNDLDKDPFILDNALKTVSMFSDKKLVILNTVKEKHVDYIENTINDSPENVFLIIKAGTLNTNSKIRKFFENSKFHLALACYEEDIKSKMSYLNHFIKINNLNLDEDSKSYLLQSLSNDRMISSHELEKIILFYKDRSKAIDLEEIKTIFNDSSSNTLDTMTISVMYGKTSKCSKIVYKLLSEGLNPISIIRNLVNYLKRVQNTKIEMKKGNTFEKSVTVLRPPLFWKDKNNFREHCMKWPLTKLNKAIITLLDTEIKCKSDSKLAKIHCEKSIMFIANDAKRLFRS